MAEPNGSQNTPREIIGLVPAGGEARRVAPLPCSKELFPVGFHTVEPGRTLRPKVVCHYLLEKMALAGITKVYVVLRKGKWDIPQYLGDGSIVDMKLAYLIMNIPFGVPYTLDQAYPFVQDALVAFGFPDIVFQPEDTFKRLLARQAATNADVVLGLFQTNDPQKMDMVDRRENGRICQIEIKPASTTLRYTWIIALWTPMFTRFIHDYLPSVSYPGRQELSLGDVLQGAIAQKLYVDSVIFSDGVCLDIGTPDDLVRAVRSEIGPKAPVQKV